MPRTKQAKEIEPTTAQAVVSVPVAPEPAPAYITPPVGFTSHPDLEPGDMVPRDAPGKDWLGAALGTDGYIGNEFFEDGRFRDPYRRRHVFKRHYFKVRVLVDIFVLGNRFELEEVQSKRSEIAKWNEANPEQAFGYIAMFPDTVLTTEKVRRLLAHEVLEAPALAPPNETVRIGR